jgi:general secretion pathway protein L
MAASQSIAERLGASFERVRMRYERSALHRFLGWWRGELATLLPASWRALFAEGSARVLYVLEPDALQVRLEEAGRDMLLTRLPLEAERSLDLRVDAALGPQRVNRPRWLLLSGAQLLRRRITLPAAAIERLRDVVSHELDRQTPFRVDQVVFDSRVLGVHDASQMAQVELLVLPKDKFEAALAPLGTLADELAGVDVRDAGTVDNPGEPLHCNLLPPQNRQPPDRSAIWLHLGLAVIAIVALLFALQHTLDNRSAALERLSAEVDAQHQKARVVGALARQLQDAADGANFLVRARASTPTMLAVLADLSARIPDNTYLERFSEQENQIYLTGLSADAPGLVAQLQSSQVLHSPALSGTLQPDAASKRDRFTLVMDLPKPPAATTTGDAHAPATR